MILVDIAPRIMLPRMLRFAIALVAAAVALPATPVLGTR